MKPIALAADHAGFELKEKIAGYLETKGFEVMDLGAHDQKPVDYPDFARAIGKVSVVLLLPLVTARIAGPGGISLLYAGSCRLSVR